MLSIKYIGGTERVTHKGYACDSKFTDKNGQAIDSKKVVLALEDLGHQKGIGYRSGGNKLYTHIDIRNRKWYGDEAISQTKPCCDYFYEYFGIKKESDVFVESDYITLEELYVRKGPGTNYGIKKYAN
ncbi:MAG: hypothetical protein IJA94_01425 [Bacilli bacterium]|nr:hypothetical protein [Bacilli bacterium]